AYYFGGGHASGAFFTLFDDVFYRLRVNQHLAYGLHAAAAVQIFGCLGAGFGGKPPEVFYFFGLACNRSGRGVGCLTFRLGKLLTLVLFSKAFNKISYVVAGFGFSG